MIEVEGLTLRLGEAPLFDGIGFRLAAGQRVALAGRNGQGKSTLMKVLVGQVGYDAGRVSVSRGTTLGYLPQDLASQRSGRTVVEEALTAFPELGRLEEEVQRLTGAIAEAPDDAGLLEAYGRAQAAFEAGGGYSADARARAILAGLGFDQERMQAPLETLSGGWRMRVHLAKLLLRAPDALLLDEPTNHLDLETREWLLEWLRGYEGALLVTSHDRFFLDALVQRVFLLEGGKLTVYHGNYSAYEVKRADDLSRLKSAYARQQKELKRQERFIERNRAKASTASNVQSRIKQLARIERIELPPEPPDIKLRFPEPPSAGALAFRLCGVAKRYGEREVFSDVELELPAGEKLAVVGVNGAGKTTLLRLVAGELEPSAGTVELGHNVLLQTFSQYEDDLPSGDRTLLQAMEEAAPPDCAVSRRTVLGCFLFGGDDVHKRIAVLSGGERARLKLARMLLRPSNLLVLDEPTNHLDLHSKDVLLAALEAFRGTVVFVSHDRWFLSRLATSVLELRDGRARLFPCDYDQYRWRVERDAREETARSPVSRESRAEAPRRRSDRPHRAGRERRREERRLQREAEEQQARLEEQEVRLAALEERMSAPGFFAGGKPESREVVLEFEELRKQVEAGYERLEELLGALEALGDAEAGGAPP